MSHTKKPEIDHVTGVETTGHEWDGIKELNKPLPQWWLWTFYACIVWSVGYWIVYPAWPTLSGYTKGIWNYSQRQTVTDEGNAARAAQATFRTKIEQAPLADIKKDPDLLRFARAAGGSAFQTNCAPCHGRGAQGFVGYPNLNDDDWLWGGTLDDIYKTIQFGVRTGHKEGRVGGTMPRYGVDKLLDEAQINAVAEFVLSLSKKETDKKAAETGAGIFKEQCAGCHGPDGRGMLDQGSANLTDAIWLYGGTKQAIVESIHQGRGGQMPWWTGRLDTVTLKSLAVYVHSLGGGK